MGQENLNEDLMGYGVFVIDSDSLDSENYGEEIIL